MNDDKVTVDTQCYACRGTGLYRGFAEAEGIFVICNKCNGTGKGSVTYTSFKGKQKREGVKRVFKGTGVGHSEQDIKHGGCSYKDWLQGKEPEPLRHRYCPYLWTGQRLQSDDVNDLNKLRCGPALGGRGTITNCKYYREKRICWEIFEGRREHESDNNNQDI